MNSASQNSSTTSEFHPALSLTRFTSRKPARLSKHFSLVGNVLDKQGGGNMTDGVAEKLAVTLAEFAALLPTLKPSQACSYGVAAHDAARVVVADAVSASNGDLPVIARTRDYFAWPAGAGLMMLDYDAPADGAPLDMHQLRDALAMTCLPLDAAPAIWRPSASSCIHVKGGAELRGVCGQRLYIPVIDASDLSRAGQVLFDRLWLAGYGRYELSKSGAWLTRSPIDASVFQPERLDFCGGASLGSGLEQHLPDPIIFNPHATYFDTRAALPDLDDAERRQLEGIRERLKTPELLAEQARVKEAWIANRVNERIAALPEPAQEAARPKMEATYRQAVDGGWLAPRFELTVKAKGAKTINKVTVGDALAQKDKYHEATCLDPLEPDYPGTGDPRYVGWLNLKHKPPYITSQAHGGTQYFLGVEPAADPGPSVSFTPAPGSQWKQVDDGGAPPEWFADIPDDDGDRDGGGMLVDGRNLRKHNEAATLLFANDFGGRLFYDPVQLDWFEYQPKAGIFDKRPGLAIEKAVYQAINRHCGSLGFDTAYISGVTKCLLYEAITEPKPAVGKICFTNGVLDLATRELLPHSPDFYFTSSLPFSWNPDAPEPALVIDWLRSAVGGHDDQVQLLRAYLNAVVVGRPDLQRFLELIGAGGSGKGTFIRLAQSLVGKGGSHSTRLKELEENRFETANLLGKRLVVIGDAEKWHGSIDTLKSITGEDSIRFEQKHKQGGEDFVFGGMVIIAGNQHTDSNDYSSGIQRRKITVPFDHVVPAGERRDLAGEFEPLLPAVLKWVLDMPHTEVTARLRNTGAYTASLRAARLDALSATNPMVAWMLDSAHFSAEASSRVGVKRKLSVSVKDGCGETITHTEYEHEADWLYPNYCRWCDQNGKQPVASRSFSSSVVDTAKNLLNKPYVAQKRDTGNASIITGITLDLPPNTYQPSPQPPEATGGNRRQPGGNPDSKTIDSDELINNRDISEVNNFVGEKDKSQGARAVLDSDCGDGCADFQPQVGNSEFASGFIGINGLGSGLPPDSLRFASGNPPTPPSLTPPQFTVMTAIRTAGLLGAARPQIAEKCPRLGGAMVKMVLGELVTAGLVAEADGRYAVKMGAQP